MTLTLESLISAIVAYAKHDIFFSFKGNAFYHTLKQKYCQNTYLQLAIFPNNQLLLK